MRRIWILVLLAVFLISAKVYAQPRGNASPATIGVNSTTTYKNITFPYTTRDLVVRNNDSTAYIYVDTKSDTNTSILAPCYLLAPATELLLYDFLTDGISILYDDGSWSTDTEASPITVIATY